MAFITSMNELRLIFHVNLQEDSTVFVKLVPRWSGGLASEPIPFQFSLTNNDYEDLRWYLEDFMDLPDGGSVVRAHSIERRLKDWGRDLHDAVFSAPANQALLKQLLASPEPGILTIGTADPGLLRLPWELIADDAGPLAHRVSVRRQLEAPETLVEREVVPPLRILYIVSRPDDTGFIDPRVTTRPVFDALDPLGASVQIDLCRPPTVGQMEEMLSKAKREGDPYDLVHFDGHGTFDPGAQLGGLYFEKPDDGSGTAVKDFVNADRFGNVVATYQVPLVILEACRSATVGRTAVFRSVAPRLIQAGVNSVLSMGHAVMVEAARRLLDRFYRELVVGAPIGEALRQARAALLARPDRWIEYGPQGRTISLQDWFLPHLYQRGHDERLLPPPLPATDSSRPRQFDVFLIHNHAEANRVEFLARRLAEKHGLRVWLDKWECKPGPLKPQCEAGIANSRYTVVVGSEAALESEWVKWEMAKAFELNPSLAKFLPIRFEELTLPDELNDLLWVDFTDPARDEVQARLLARLIRSSDAEDARKLRGFRSPSTNKADVGAFPPAPMYEFQGRARELHKLERQFQAPDDPNDPNQPKRAHRAIVLHAMGGMGKTALATEAAHWWTRSGLFRDGACFISFEQFASAERVEQILGTYLEGPNFESLPATEQRRRAIELFNERDVLLVWDNFESVLPQFSEASRNPQLNQEHADQAGAAQISGSNDASSLAQDGPYTADERARLFDLFRDLIASPNGHGRLLITCRPGETGLPGVLKIELQGLARADSLWLLSRVIAKDGLTLNDPRLAKEKLEPLLATLADHPLSIELVAPHLKKLTPEAIIVDFAKLIAEFRRGKGVERNESLLASLAFSTNRLSEAAQTALPWLGMFSGGVFEQLLLDVSELHPEQWETARAELEATALIRVEHSFLLGGRPYLRFHPTLAYATQRGPLPDSEVTRRRFVGVYLGVRNSADSALKGSHSRVALELLALEESNFRAAVRWAVELEEYDAASNLGEMFNLYLQSSGRLRERDAWVIWFAGKMRKGGFSKALVGGECNEAWTLLSQGLAGEAISRMEKLIARLRLTSEFDPAFQMAQAQSMLARILDESGLSARAISASEEAVKQWETVVTRVDAGADNEVERDNLAVALGDLVSALTSAGHLEAALTVAERELVAARELGHDRHLAVSFDRIARILMEQGRYREADSRFDDALAAVHRTGDKELEGTILQHKGGLADDLQQYARATSLYQQALKLFQEMNDEGSIMRTCNLLGVVEHNQGRLIEARTWYERSLEIARRLNDIPIQGAAAQNIGIICTLEGETARHQGREPEARQRFEEARRFVTESLQLKQRRGNESASALSLRQLATIHLLLGELDEAEHNARDCIEIDERLGIIREMPFVYYILSCIGRARGDEAQATEWERKRDAVLEELERRAGGPGGLPPQFLQAVQSLAEVCARAAVEHVLLEPEALDALDRVAEMPPPLPGLASFLRRVAAGELPSVPTDLPSDLNEYLTQLLQAVKDSH